MKLTIGDPSIWEGNSKVAATWEEGAFRRFALVGRTDIISAQVESPMLNGGKLLLFPERSAQHKVLLVALQEPGVDA